MGVELDKDLIQVSNLISVIYLAHGEGKKGMGVELDKDLIQVMVIYLIYLAHGEGKKGMGAGARQRLDPGQ